MSEAAVQHVDSEQEREATEPSRSRTRTCVGCGEHVELGAGAEELVRLIVGPNGEVAVDARGGGFGRGAHVHPRRPCLERAVQRGLARSAKGQVHTLLPGEAGEPGAEPEALSVASLARAIQASMDRRIEGLLGTAVRTRRLARGSDAVTGACRRDEAHLVVVARDAAAAADLTEVRRAVAEGRAVAWGTKQRLGQIVDPRAARITNGAESVAVGVVAVIDTRIAGALRSAVHIADACAAMTAPETSDHGAKPRGQARERRNVLPVAGAVPVDGTRAAPRADAVGRSGSTAKPGNPRQKRSPVGGRRERADARGRRNDG